MEEGQLGVEKGGVRGRGGLLSRGLGSDIMLSVEYTVINIPASRLCILNTRSTKYGTLCS